MSIILTSAFIVLSITLLKRIFSKEWKIIEGLYLFIILMSSLFVFSKCNANEIPNPRYEQIQILRNAVYVITDEHTLPSTLKEWLRLMEQHIKKGDECVESFKNKCWYLPDVEKRERAKEFLIAFFAALSPAESKYRVITALFTFAMQYSIDCLDEWIEMEQDLLRADYHYEMAAFYAQLINDATKKE